ncbi:UvrD-helicase domain-containing protein [Flavobacterium sp. 245]|uniref:UvrD-helicase domain-containing protein n=1 Tax=Flavobacterium sp. 245 TaxID=2512115 RepID=UPI00105E9813|nr:ATP-dependent helicase [Flavobacterium sp. 245]TDO96111.1 DNA helicase-2/ATP-dependent DNA helicase PcrA [Flavobacterium sp. 245]
MNSNFFLDLELIKKDEQQYKAFNSNSNTVVIAGPGSGKTRVLALKAIKIKTFEVFNPAGLACITYSNETVRELTNRLHQYSYKQNKQDFIGTIHNFCLVNIIKPFIHLYPEFNIDKDFKIADNSTLEKILRSVKHELNIDEEISLMSLNKHRSLAFTGRGEFTYNGNENIERLSKLFDYKLESANLLDFTSIVNISTAIIREKEIVRKFLEARFPWILIDEYQDLGRGLHEMVLELQAQTDIKIFAVGDMNQSIYGFNGAFPEFLEEIYKYDEFESIELTSNYRSNQDIISGSLSTLNLSPPIPNYTAQLRVGENAEFTFIQCATDIEEQYEVIINKIIPNLVKKGISYNDIGILAFSKNEINHLSLLFEYNHIPFYTNKWSFRITPFIEWIINCASWCLGVEESSFNKIFKFWNRQQIEYLEIENNENFMIESRVKFYNSLVKSKEYNENISIWLDFIFSELEFGSVINSDKYLEEDKLNLEHFTREFSAEKKIPIYKLLKLRKPENQITITTRHSSKGLEFEAVIMIGMEEGKFPYYNIENNSLEMQEQHRICYVCISRAKKECILLYSKRYNFIGQYGPYHRNYNPSRFWNLLAERFGTDQNTFTSTSYN